ncbi:MAG: methyltransferase domain-containing protein [Alphaproteobacteria bacterium]|jgi:SAM-dependent methyltransferase|nr:methyltransferase domain-containing protein [Alphaproteobacteria bacterium]
MNPQMKPLMDAVLANYAPFAKLSAGLVNQWDQFVIHATGYDLIPPVWLRYRIQGTPDIETYVKAGRGSRQSIELALESQGRRLTDMSDILDFGCGCGRTLRWFRDIAGSVRLHGTDIDSEAIAWNRTAYDFASFNSNGMEPPLDYPDNSFDLIYALSVFTHLTEEAQVKWLEELNRVLKPDGLALLTFLGYRPEKVRRPKNQPVPRIFGRRVLGLVSMDMWDFLDQSDIAELEDKGFAFVPYDIGPLGKAYGITYHRRDYVESRLTQIMPLRAYLPDGFCNYLDIGLFGKAVPKPPTAKKTPGKSAPDKKAAKSEPSAGPAYGDAPKDEPPAEAADPTAPSS